MKPIFHSATLHRWFFLVILSLTINPTLAQFPPSMPLPVILDTITFNGDLILSGSDMLTIENTDYRVNGNVYLSGNAQLIIRQSVLRINHYPRQEMFISDNARVVADTSIFFDLVHAFFSNNTQIDMDNCLFINLLQMDGQSVANISNSYIYSEPFGLLQPGEECNINIHNTVIGAIGLNLPDKLFYDITNLNPGFYDYWSAEEAISPDLPYTLVMTDTELKDNPGYSGGYEMGWNLMTTSAVDLSISNSVLNKLIIGFTNENVTFSGLHTRVPVDFSYKNISLTNTTIQNQWGIFVENGETTITNSEGIWLWPVGDKITFVSNTKVNEFDPREFTGTVVMEECAMNNGFEIYSNCDFRLEGGIRLAETVPLWDQSSMLTRNYQIYLFDDASGSPLPGIALALQKSNNVIWRDTTQEDGMVSFDITFDYNNHLDNWQLKSEDNDIWLDKDISIRSFTPHLIRLELAPDSMHLRQVVYVDDSNPFNGTGIPGDPFRDIEEGINHCSRSGIVRVAKGVYNCSVYMADDIFILGSGPDSTWIQGDVMAWDIEGAQISGFRIDDGQTAGIHCYNSEVTISNNVISGQPHNGIHCSNSTLTVINNTITENGLNGFFLIDSSTVEIRNNIVSGNGGLGIVALQSGLLAINYNDFWNNLEGNYGTGIAPGPNDVSEDPMFIDPAANDFQLMEGSPCIDTGDPDPAFNDPGGSRNDMGAFGGPCSNMPGNNLIVREPCATDNMALFQNYPNPFSQSTTISYNLSEAGYVRMIIYGLVGNEVRTLISETKEAGASSCVWDGKDNGGARVMEGIYFYRLTTSNSEISRKMIMLR